MRRSRRGSGAVEKEARRLVYARSGGKCEGCLVRVATDWSHRINRSQGGPWTASNGLHLCRGCHNWIGAEPNAANEVGWYLRSHQNPLTEPVQLRRGRVWLTDLGTFSLTPPTLEATT